MPLRKYNDAAKFIVSLKQNNSEDFLIFKKLRKSTFQKRLKKRPNANLYVEYSRTYDFLRILSSLIRQLNGLKTFVAPFLPTRLTASGSPRMKTTTFYAK